MCYTLNKYRQLCSVIVCVYVRVSVSEKVYTVNHSHSLMSYFHYGFVQFVIDFWCFLFTKFFERNFHSKIQWKSFSNSTRGENKPETSCIGWACINWRDIALPLSLVRFGDFHKSTASFTYKNYWPNAPTIVLLVFGLISGDWG